MFHFIRREDTTSFEGRHWHEFLERWLQLIHPANLFREIEGQTVTLANLTAAEYAASDPLDLDHLSPGAQPTR
jgi:hypothetical protein